MSEANTESALTSEQQAAIARWLRGAADVLRLKDWLLIVGSSPPNDGAYATVSVGQYQEGYFRVSPLLLNEPADKVRHVLIHELLHMYHSDVLDMMVAVAPGATEHDKQAMQAVVERYIERMVDAMAWVVAGLPNLPDIGPVMQADASKVLYKDHAS